MVKTLNKNIPSRLPNLLIGAIVSLLFVVWGATFADDNADIVEQGKALALDVEKGNCVACHMVGDAEFPGNHGPPLIFMKQRFPDKERLKSRIYDATAVNPYTMMPPYGLHGILTPEELDMVVEYIYTL